jgi:peptidoglycan/xylan/chitin deacetylase (PgdA/CDA1 family)
MRKTFSPQRRSGLAEARRGFTRNKLRVTLRNLCVSAVSLFLFSQLTMAQSPPIYVTLWFDTEDYILPQSDDAAKRLAEMLTRLGIKATFKIVGEKARVLEQRGRKDVIAALKKHEIGYHSNYHSIHPTPAEYLQNADWDEGVAEFYRREISGVQDIQRIFGVTPSCYGQPGSSWGPQSHAALKRMGINVYLDDSTHVGIDGQPFYYGGILNIFNMRPNLCRMDLYGEGHVAKGKAQFLTIYENLKAKGGGTVSIYYHPCEWVHQEFWDGVNFSRGANPPRSEWKLPKTRTSEETEKAFRDFEEYAKFIKAQAGVRYVTANELAKLYEEQSQQEFVKYDDYFLLAKAVQAEISFQKIGDIYLSAAEVFSLLTKTVAAQWAEKPPKPEKPQPLLGPSRPFSPSIPGKKIEIVTDREFVMAVFDVAKYCEGHRRIPAEIKIGAASISPEDYLATLGAFVQRLAEPNTSLSAPVQILRGNFTADKYVANDDPKIFNWVIHPEGFHAPKMMGLAKLQAWTLKPAVMKK